jgi:hypothetical protein
LSAVSVAETLLVYVGIPLAVVLVIAALTFLPGGRRRPRWKSGQPWAHDPVWFEPHPEATGLDAGVGHGAAHGDGHAAIGGGRGATALTAGSHAEATAPTPVSAGPLGGARGTW